MSFLKVHTAEGIRVLSFEGAAPLSRVLAEGGLYIPRPCGGRGVCGKCRVEIAGCVSQPDERERELGCRLACRVRLEGDAEVFLSGEEIRTESAQEDLSAGTGEGIAAAADIGTTTVALNLYDLADGRRLFSRTAVNPQRTVAADVMGRIGAALSGRLEEQRKLITDCLISLAEETGAREEIRRWVVTGNTTMLYLLTGRSPASLAAAPFRADRLFGEETVLDGRAAYLPPCVHAFVGADTVCALLYAGITEKRETVMLCDIGTNGEIALWREGRLYVTSTAAGPAFEGAGLSCGCCAVPGAVDRVTAENGRLKAETIGGLPPSGLCGSGVTDALAALLELEEIDETGAAEADRLSVAGPVYLSAGDIRQIQLAKAAIAAGMETLLKVSGTESRQVSRLLIAGGFGSHMRVSSAVRIGLIPRALSGRTEILGNAALKGAALLLDEKRRGEAQRIAALAEHVDLGGNPFFNARYIENMLFPEAEEC